MDVPKFLNDIPNFLKIRFGMGKFYYNNYSFKENYKITVTECGFKNICELLKP